jgi:threonine/homoserine/homoserine lactone efflux protein
VPLTAVAAFWAVSFALVITPGADWAYVISAGLRGRRLACSAVVGLACGALLATAAVAAGVGALVASHPIVLTVLTVADSAYLLWMGVAMLRRPAATVSAQSELVGGGWKWACKAAGISSFNPKLILLLLALLPQFVHAESAWPVTLQIMMLGAVHALSCCGVYLAVGLAAQRVLGSRPGAALVVSRVSGALMLGIALLLLAERAMH